MNNMAKLITGLAIAAICTMATTSDAQTVNVWRGNEIPASWTEAYKWKLKHLPTGEESIHFREPTSVVSIDSTVDVGNGLLLYGQELCFVGNGNLNLQNPVAHKSTVFVPASATGYANLTINDNLTINGRIALSAKAYGTSASKGSVTLKNRSTIEGVLIIGNDGSGSGKVYIRDQSVYRISGLELNTLAAQGGAAEIHILGGTAQIECGSDPFAAFLADSSRKIFIGDYGTLRIHSDLPVERKKDAVLQLLSNQQLVAASGNKIMVPVFQDNMLIIKAERTDKPQDLATLLASIRTTGSSGPASLASAKQGNPQPQTIGLEEFSKQTRAGEHADASAAQSKAAAEDAAPPSAAALPVTGYFVFVSAFLLLLRPVKRD